MPGGSYAALHKQQQAEAEAPQRTKSPAARTAAPAARGRTPPSGQQQSTGARPPFRPGHSGSRASKSSVYTGAMTQPWAAGASQHPGSAAYHAVMARQRRTRSRTPSNAPPAAVRSGLNASPSQSFGGSPPQAGNGSEGAMTVGHRADALSSEIFRSKLHSIMALREQIEALAAKHRTEEEALRSVLDSMKFETDREVRNNQTNEELVRALAERDKTIEMLDTFRREGNAVITRMHENLKRSADQNESAVHRIEELTKANEKLKQQLATANTGDADAPAVAGDPAKIIADYEARCVMYSELIEDSEDVIKHLRLQVSSLQQQLAAGGGAGGDVASPGARPSAVGSTAGDAASPARPEEAQAAIDQLRDQLRGERRQRLQSEEQSQHILQEQQRHIDLLEQRLAAQSNRERASTGGTPRSARAGAAPSSSANHRRPSDAGGAPPTPTRSGFSQHRGVSGDLPPISAEGSSRGTPTVSSPQSAAPQPVPADAPQQAESSSPAERTPSPPLEDQESPARSDTRSPLVKDEVREDSVTVAELPATTSPIHREQESEPTVMAAAAGDEKAADGSPAVAGSSGKLPTASASPGNGHTEDDSFDDNVDDEDSATDEEEEEAHAASMHRINDLQRQLNSIQESMDAPA